MADIEQHHFGSQWNSSIPDFIPDELVVEELYGDTQPCELVCNAFIEIRRKLGSPPQLFSIPDAEGLELMLVSPGASEDGDYVGVERIMFNQRMTDIATDSRKVIIDDYGVNLETGDVGHIHSEVMLASPNDEGNTGYDVTDQTGPLIMNNTGDVTIFTGVNYEQLDICAESQPVNRDLMMLDLARRMSPYLHIHQDPIEKIHVQFKG